MRHHILNLKSLMFLFAIVLLSYGTQGISYGQVCSVGDRIAPGESCTYPGTNIEFSVLNNGSGRFLFFTAGTAINARNVTVNGVRYNFAASKQADGTWLIEAAGDGSTPPPVSKPDLVVQQPTVSNSTLAPGENFTLSATVKNQGAGSAAATTLRYYRSTNTTISASDTEVGTDSVNALGANRSSAESITLAAPSSPGTYYYGACVAGVSGESSSDNNCSAAVSITVQRAPVVSTPSQPFIYWTDGGTDKIQRANLDGSNVQTLVTHAQGLSLAWHIALGLPSQTLPPTSGGQAPDLVLEAVQAVPATVAPGETFKLHATLKNQGTAQSAATTVRYYQSTDNVISTTDTQLGTGNRNPLAPNGTIRRHLSITAPTTPGTY